MVYQLALSRPMHIQSIPMCECLCMGIGNGNLNRCTNKGSPGTGSHNNYAYLVIDDKSESKDAVIIDPAHPEEYALTMTIHQNRGKLAERFLQNIPCPQTSK